MTTTLQNLRKPNEDRYVRVTQCKSSTQIDGTLNTEARTLQSAANLAALSYTCCNTGRAYYMTAIVQGVFKYYVAAIIQDVFKYYLAAIIQGVFKYYVAAIIQDVLKYYIQSVYKYYITVLIQCVIGYYIAPIIQGVVKII
jgi:hypothetical protein